MLEQKFGSVEFPPTVELPSSVVEECEGDHGGNKNCSPGLTPSGKPRHMRAISDGVVPHVGRTSSRDMLLSSTSQIDASSVTSETSRPDEDLNFQGVRVV